MQVEVKLFAGLQKYLPENSSKNSCRLETGQTDSIKDILRRLEIPSQRFSGLLIMANGTHVELDYILEISDVISVFPAIGGG